MGQSQFDQASLSFAQAMKVENSKEMFYEGLAHLANGMDDIRSLLEEIKKELSQNKKG